MSQITFRDPTEDEALALFEKFEGQFPTQTVGQGKWYITLVSTHNPWIEPLSDDIIACGSGQRWPAHLRADPVQTPYPTTRIFILGTTARTDAKATRSLGQACLCCWRLQTT